MDIHKGEILAFIGPSGTGKSTFLRCLNYLTVPTTGIITIDDVRVDAKCYTAKDIRELRKHSSMVFQNYNLFKNKTAIENIMEALIIVHGMAKKEAESRAMTLLKKSDLKNGGIFIRPSYQEASNNVSPLPGPLRSTLLFCYLTNLHRHLTRN